MGEEFLVDHLFVYGRECQGCVKHGKEIMVSFTDENGKIIDIFLSRESADIFSRNLNRQISINKIEEIIN